MSDSGKVDFDEPTEDSRKAKRAPRRVPSQRELVTTRNTADDPMDQLRALEADILAAARERARILAALEAAYGTQMESADDPAKKEARQARPLASELRAAAEQRVFWLEEAAAGQRALAQLGLDTTEAKWRADQADGQMTQLHADLLIARARLEANNSAINSLMREAVRRSHPLRKVWWITQQESQRNGRMRLALSNLVEVADARGRALAAVDRALVRAWRRARSLESDLMSRLAAKQGQLQEGRHVGQFGSLSPHQDLMRGAGAPHLWMYHYGLARAEAGAETVAELSELTEDPVVQVETQFTRAVFEEDPELRAAVGRGAAASAGAAAGAHRPGSSPMRPASAGAGPTKMSFEEQEAAMWAADDGVDYRRDRGLDIATGRRLLDPEATIRRGARLY